MFDKRIALQSRGKRENGSLRYSRKLIDLPGPKGVPVLGNARQIDTARLHLTIENWAREFGPLYQMRLGRTQVLVVSDPVVIGELLRDRPNTILRSSRASKILSEVGADGVFTAEGNEWRQQRKLVMRAMTPEVVRNFFPTMVLMTERLLNRWKTASANGLPVDMMRDLKTYALDVTVAMAMGHDSNMLENDDIPLQRDIEFVLERVAHRLTAPIPYWRFIKLPVDRRAANAVERIGSAMEGFMAQARQQLEIHPERRIKPTNMMEALLAARDEPGSGFTDADVIGNAATMVYAGEDTTANAIAWLMNFIARDRRTAGLIAAEADAALRTGKVLNDYAGLDAFAYTEAAAYEALRMKPVVPFLSHEIDADTVIADTLIPRGTLILTALRHAGQHDADFPEPAEFRPERWLSDERTSMNGEATRKVFPFGGGARFCPGRFVAMAQIKMVMSMVTRNFELAIDEAAPPVEEIFAFSMTPNQLPIRLISRVAS